MVQVEREAPLVAVEGLEEKRVLALLVGVDVAPDIASGGGVLHLDHLRAEVGELHRPPRPGAVLLDREDPDVGERRLAHVAIPAARPRSATEMASLREASSIISPSK